MSQCGSAIIARQLDRDRYRIGVDRVRIAFCFITRVSIGFTAINVFKAEGLKQRGGRVFIGDCLPARRQVLPSSSWRVA